MQSIFDSLTGFWDLLKGMAAQPDTTAAATKLAQLGDESIMAPLFDDKNVWSPTYLEGDPLLSQGKPMLGQGKPILQQGLMPQMMPNEKDLPYSKMILGATGNYERPTQPNAPQVPTGAMAGRSELTPEQLKELLGLMPGDKSQAQMPLPPPGAMRPAGLSGNMQMLQTAPLAAQRPMTLAELIYGRR